MEEITNQKFKEQIIFMMNNTVFGNNNYSFLGQNFINIEKKNLFKLENFEYFFYKKDTVKTKRGVLYLFIDNNGHNNCVVILKDFTIYNLKNVKTIEEYYSGSLFDISFEQDEVIIYDTFMISGYHKNRLFFSERITEAEAFLHNFISDTRIKIATYFKEINFEVSENEELFMIPNCLPLVNGINYSAFKWKPCNLITFSLKCVENCEDLDMYTTNFRVLKLFAKIYYSDPQGKEYITRVKNLENYSNECIIDINLINNVIEIVRVNDIKTLPNNIRSIEKILTIKHENIEMSQLISSVS